MSLRSYLHRLEAENRLVRIGKPVSKTYEMAGILKKIEPSPVLFEQTRESAFRVAGNLFCTKADFAAYFGIPVAQIIPTLLRAIQNPRPCPVLAAGEQAPCQEVVVLDPDLDALPILRHCERDGGNFISSGVFLARHPLHGQNADFHRAMQFSTTEMAVRVVRGRHFDAFLRDRKALDVAICIGNAPNVLAAAATSVALGVNELEIANALEEVTVVRARTVDVMVPAESEFVLEGTVYLDRLHDEGPFVDLTETYDVIRQEPVLVIKAITHRRDAIWHALLPGALEHKLLMGMPREPTIFQKVNEVVRCLDVNINPGGCSWLHAVVQIDKQREEDGKQAIRAAFAGHRSCKHVYVVDKDVDIYDPLAVEWAMATRFQGDQDLVILPREPGSSLDPSSTPGTHETTRVGFDLTKPLETHGKSFDKAPFPEVNLRDYGMGL
ncbi:MAG TPA: UbiD family decarboxylase [Anaerolineaceae bacterium]|nr:UbiD family decarboxylase [Anaerolineaceae bacterium]